MKYYYWRVMEMMLLFVVALLLPKSALTSNYLTMLYQNRSLYDGENVLVSANEEETRKEAVVTCVARQIDPQQSLVFQFHAQNSILLEPKDSQWLDNNNLEGFTIGRRRIVLETGGFLKLQCAITSHNKPIATMSANFSFIYRDPNQTPSFAAPPRVWPVPNAVSLTSSTRRPVIPPPVMHVNNNNNSGANTLHITRYMLTFKCIVLCIILHYLNNES